MSSITLFDRGPSGDVDYLSVSFSGFRLFAFYVSIESCRIFLLLDRHDCRFPAFQPQTPHHLPQDAFSPATWKKWDGCQVGARLVVIHTIFLDVLFIYRNSDSGQTFFALTLEILI